jgi:N-acetylmuramoyl-L-alanine amidase
VNKRLISLFIVFTAYFSCAWTLLPGGGYKIKTIVIDAGHGGKDPGNMGTGRYKTSEKHVALEVALKLGEKIKAEFPEIKVIYTRDKDVFIGLDERAKIANAANADLFISIHCNAAKNLGANGTETFVLGLHKTEENLLIAQQENSVIFMEDDYETKYEGFDPNSAESMIALTMMQSAFLNQSIELSAHVQDEFVKQTHREERGVKQAGFLVLRKTTMPSILIELGFLTNKTDEDFLVSANGKEKMSLAVFNAFKTYKSKHETDGSGIAPSEIENKKTPEQLKADADAKTKAEADKKLKEEAELKAKLETEQKRLQEENAALKAKQETETKTQSEKKAKEQAELKAKEEADAKAKAFAELTAKLQAEKKAKEQAELKTKQDAEAKAKSAAEAKTKEQSEIKSAAENKAKEAQELKAKEDAEHIAKLKAIKEQDIKEQENQKNAQQKAEAQALLEEEKKNQEKAQLLAEFNQRIKEKEELEAIKRQQEEALNRIKIAADENAKLGEKVEEKIDAELFEKSKTNDAEYKKAEALAEQKAKEEAALKAKQEAEAKKLTEETKMKADAEAKAKLEAEQKEKQLADEKANQEAEKRAKAEAEQKLKQEAEAKAKAQAESINKEQAELEEKAKQEAIARKRSDEVAELEREVMLAKKEELLRKIKETLDNPTDQSAVKIESKKEEPKKTEVKEQVKTQPQVETKPKETVATEKLVFRVQFFSSPTSFPLSSPKFSGLDNIYEYQTSGLHKYASGNFDSIEAATAHQVKVRKAGFTDAFVIAFLNGERIDMAKAREILNK